MQSTVERPLERARPLPDRLVALARAIAGRVVPPRYTSGHATKRALRAAGARGATTGSVVHLPRPPDFSPQALGVVAHELAHAGERSTVPRFFLAGSGSHVDAGERQARRVGETVRSLAASGIPRGSGGAPELGDVVAPVGVGGLPVGGPVGAGTAVRHAADAAVTRALAGGSTGPATAGDLVANTVSGQRAGLEQLRGAGGIDAADVAPQTHAGEAVRGGVERIFGASAEGPAGETGGGPFPSTANSATEDPYSQFGELVERLEERLLAEIERRGGRYAGVF